jgi:hypothetical protein
MSISGIVNLLQQYAEGGNAAPGQERAEQDFESVARNATPSHLAQGLTQAFNSDKTPPFAEMVANLFNQSNPQQRAGLLNQLLGSAGSGGLGALLQGGPGSVLQSGLGSLLQGRSEGQISEEDAERIDPGQVKQVAERAQQANPSIVEMVSRFYAQHPTLVKSLGAGALALIMGHMYEKREYS